ncbi:MAG: amidoligase family protein [Gammaproteobacteria bacterium]|nr:amidoligase family protein [Gammaproteobacteria bacterium]
MKPGIDAMHRAPQSKLLLPPRLQNREQGERRVGVELEFAAISARAGAQHVQAVYGGQIEQEDPHRFHIRGSALGDFVCELDNQYVHRPLGEDGEAKGVGAFEQFLHRFRDDMREFFGDVGSLFIPCEIVCPPIPVTELRSLESLVQRLCQAGASGTRSNPIFSFGAHLNPEIADGDDSWVIAVFKAELLLSAWLRAVMSIDFTRRLFAFAEPFPRDYVVEVVDPDYWPDLERFTTDYLIASPDRNRELDLLPLFAWLDPHKVQRYVDDPLVKPRPTFHYRLPDANIDQPDWGLVLEWNRWCLVERLAEQRELLNRMGAAFLANQQRMIPENWALRASEWLLIG